MVVDDGTTQPFLNGGGDEGGLLLSDGSLHKFTGQADCGKETAEWEERHALVRPLCVCLLRYRMSAGKPLSNQSVHVGWRQHRSPLGRMCWSRL